MPLSKLFRGPIGYVLIDFSKHPHLIQVPLRAKDTGQQSDVERMLCRPSLGCDCLARASRRGTFELLERFFLGDLQDPAQQTATDRSHRADVDRESSRGTQSARVGISYQPKLCLRRLSPFSPYKQTCCLLAGQEFYRLSFLRQDFLECVSATRSLSIAQSGAAPLRARHARPDTFRPRQPSQPRNRPSTYPHDRTPILPILGIASRVRLRASEQGRAGCGAQSAVPCQL